MATSSSSDFEELFLEICRIFRVHELNSLQKDAVRAIKEGNDVLVCTKTGSGKSLMYQSAIVIQNRSTSSVPRSGSALDVGLTNCENYIGIVIVVVPLLAIMKEHTTKLMDLGFKATYIGKDVQENMKILAGEFQFLYARPEDIVGNQKWRDVLSGDLYRSTICCIVVDEAHAVINWGESQQAGEDPFRIWFFRIGELRSLCPGVPLVALTATASPPKRKKIMKSLCMPSLTTQLILDSPDRPNIKLNVKCIKASVELEDMFGWLLKETTMDLPKHIVFCQKLSDTSKLYKLFKAKGCLGHVEMYHSKTLTHIQDAIREDMEKPNGRIRVLFCTNAAGMGVNFVGVNNVVNFGPPADLDTLLQQMGRAGRDGSQSQHLLLYNKRQLRKCDAHVLDFLRNDTSCRRETLLQSYGASEADSNVLTKHLCCDVCSMDCDCGQEDCEDIHEWVVWINTHKSEVEEKDSGVVYRKSTLVQKEQFKGLLEKYKAKELKHPGINIVDDIVLHCLSDSMISEIVESCDIINSAADVLHHTSVMSFSQAQDICDLLPLVFPGSVFDVDDDETDDEDYDI